MREPVPLVPAARLALIRRRRSASAPALPADVDVLFSRHVAEWPYLDASEREQLREGTATTLAAVSWEAARGFALTDAMCSIIAAQCAVMTLGFDDGARAAVLRRVARFVVHPSTITSTGPRPGPIEGTMSDGPVHLHGEAHHHRGPVLLAWSVVRRETAQHGNGRNVVIHEVAHKVDMLDGVVDGTPPLLHDERQRRWVDVCTREYERLLAGDGEGDPVLRDYASTDPGEFFAVASEVFFDHPLAMAAHKPELYEVFADFFGRDPAARRIATV